MSYKTLYRKYRPRNFNEVIGQDNIVSTFKNIIERNKVGHAYLFSGPRGTGKTSLAKIFAMVLNCENINDDHSPCLKCKPCTESLRLSSLDIIEIDAASNNGVSEIRDIREKVKFAPSYSKNKVYIIDEVHMLSKGAFNALLKTLEEPPTNVIFIMATTEPDRIPTTILSRVQRFNFKRIQNNIIEKQLTKIFELENVKYDQESLKLISRLAHGGMRDALSIAEQVISYSNGILTFDSVSQVFGLVSKHNLITILNYLYAGKVDKVLHLLNDLMDNGANINWFINNTLEIIKEFVIYEKTHDQSLISFLTMQDINEIKIDLDYSYKIMDELVSLMLKFKKSNTNINVLILSLVKVANPKSENYEEETNFENEDISINKNEVISLIGRSTVWLLTGAERLHTFNVDVINTNAGSTLIPVFFLPFSPEVQW
ncbi:MAG: DNA polymerase III subunit gamma/tau [Mycoplasma sp.]|nr:DNA polymerase III subunit gamma/tau [Mycoplasma sp.]